MKGLQTSALSLGCHTALCRLAMHERIRVWILCCDPVGPHPPEHYLEDLCLNSDRRAPVQPNCLFKASDILDAVSSDYVHLHFHPRRAVFRAGTAGTTRGDFLFDLENAHFAGPKGAIGDR